jgi:hypothetical protein
MPDMFKIEPDHTGTFVIQTRLGYPVDAATRQAAGWNNYTGPGLTMAEAEAACGHLNRWHDGQKVIKNRAKQLRNNTDEIVFETVDNLPDML